ncbi:hypothetical protein CR513_57549, partial [Mucuna pruriens]
MREFELQRMKESETIKEYSDKLLSIDNKIRLLGSDFANSKIIEKLLVTIPKRYEALINSLENSKDLSKITLTEVLHALMAQEQRRLMREDRAVEGALLAKHHDAGCNKKKFLKKNQSTSSENTTNNQNKGKGKKKSYPPCQYCGKIGHPPYRCWRRPDAKCSSNSSSESWLIDSGCTNHMTYDRELFKCLDNTEVKWVRIRNGEQIPVKGKGSIAITRHNGTKTLFDVLYVPEINQNLLSVGQLLEKGFKVIFEDKSCIIKSPTGLEIFKVKMKSKSLSFDPMKEQVAFPVIASSVDLWHKRLGHLHHLGINYMLKNQLVRGVPFLIEKLAECEACNFRKQTRKPFPESSWRESQKSKLVHTDKFKAHVENQSNCRIQILRLDNGKEYIATQFQQFCDEAGIEHQLTAPYTQQNGVSERKNRSIMEMARCMLHQKELPKKFWAEAANTTVFIQNRILHERYKIKLLLKPDTVDDAPIRGTRLLSDIYQKSNVEVCNIAVCEPAIFEEAAMEQKWLVGMKEEMSMIKKNQTWMLVPRPHDRNVIGVKWVFRTKINPDGSLNKHKARLVVKGYSQIFGVDYAYTFAIVVRFDTKEEIHVEESEGFVIKGQEDKVYLLKKALYGLKQAPRVWYSRINEYLFSLGFKRSQSEATLYVKHVDADILIISLYVDDLLVTRSNPALINQFKQEMKDVFEMTNLSLMNYFPGMEINQKKNEIFICQKKICKGNPKNVLAG